MSLGLIVAVIFAVVFLSLGVVWVSSFMSDISGLSVDLIQEGRTKIKETFSSTNQRFAVYPEEWDLNSRQPLKMVAGIINKEADSREHDFVVNVIPTEPETEEWINEAEFRRPLKAEFGKILNFPITITPDADALAGTYVFYIIACIDKPFSDCDEPSKQNYEAAQYLRLTIIN